MDNHLHVLLRLDSSRANGWSDDEVARRWLRLFPLRGVDGQALPVSEARVRQIADDAQTVSQLRKRLSDLSWFMKWELNGQARKLGDQRHLRSSVLLYGHGA
jgi:hypothetical protein